MSGDDGVLSAAVAEVRKVIYRRDSEGTDDLGADLAAALLPLARAVLPRPVERGLECYHGSPGGCLSYRCGSTCDQRFDRMHPCPACLVVEMRDAEQRGYDRGRAEVPSALGEDDVFGDLALRVARAVEGEVASAVNGWDADLVRVERCYSHGIARAALTEVRAALTGQPSTTGPDAGMGAPEPARTV